MDWETGESHQALANLGIGSRVDLTALGVTEKLVQGIVISLSVVISCMLADVTSVADGIVNWTVGSGLLRSIIAIVGGVVAVTGRAGMHLGTMVIIVASGGSIDVALHTFTTLPVSRALTCMTVLFRGAKENGVVGVCLDVLLQILRTLESLSTEVTFVRLEWDVDSDVRSDMVTLYGSSAALIPTTGEVKVICAFATDMLLANVFKESLGGRASLGALIPLTGQVVVGGNSWARCLSSSSRCRSCGSFWPRFLGGGSRHGDPT